jgi:hypothetical protein
VLLVLWHTQCSLQYTTGESLKALSQEIGVDAAHFLFALSIFRGNKYQAFSDNGVVKLKVAVFIREQNVDARYNVVVQHS